MTRTILWYIKKYRVGGKSRTHLKTNNHISMYEIYYGKYNISQVKYLARVMVVSEQHLKNARISPDGINKIYNLAVIRKLM